MVEMDQEAVGPRRSKIAENTASLAVSGAATMLLTMVQLGILSRYLGSGTFGLFVVLRGFALILSAVMLIGLPQVLVRFIPSYQSRGGRGSAVALFTGSSAIVVILGSLLYEFGDLWSTLMLRSIHVSELSGATVQWVALAACALALKMLIYGGFNGLRQMHMQMVLEFLYMGGLTFYILLRREMLGVEMLFEAIFYLNAVVFLLGVPFFFGSVSRLIPKARMVTGEGIVLPSLLPYWVGSILLSLVALAFSDVDRFVMSTVLPVSAVSLFHVASRVDYLIKRFLGMPIVAAQPEITRIYEEGRWGELAGKIGLFTKGTFVASLCVTAVAAIVGGDVVVLLSGREYGAAYHVLLVLLATVPIAAVIAPLVVTMRSLHFMRWAVLCDLLFMAVYFGTFVFFVRLFGVTGMAVAQVAASIVQMVTAIVLAKREGFYGGAGARSLRALAVFVVAVPAGILLTARFGMPASLAVILFSPVVIKLVIDRLTIFDADEKLQIIRLIPFATGRRAAAWVLSTEAE